MFAGRLHGAAAAGLRLLPPEQAHGLAMAGLRAGLGPRVRADRWPSLALTLAGLKLPNPIGLAAGLDKNAEAPDALLACGFGFVECGAATPRPQPGSPPPRLFRLPQERALINRMGFNNAGVEAIVGRLAARRGHGVTGLNIGANKDSPDRAGDYVAVLERAWPHIDYATLNISSPNTPGLRSLQERGPLEELLCRIAAVRATLAQGPAKPIFLKVAPDLDERQIADIAELALAHGVDALIVSNTTLSRPEGLAGAHRREAGGLSGRPLFARSTQMLALFAEASGGRLALIGSGGVESGATALAKIKAGASAVQLYSAFVFEGPGIAAQIAAELAQLLAAEGFSHVGEAVGAGL